MEDPNVPARKPSTEDSSGQHTNALTEDEREALTSDMFQCLELEEDELEEDEDIMKSPFVEPGLASNKNAPTNKVPGQNTQGVGGEKSEDKPSAWSSTKKPTAPAGKPAPGRGLLIGSGRVAAQTTIKPKPTIKFTQEQIKVANQSAFQLAGKNPRTAYPWLFDQNKPNKSLTALNSAIASMCNSPGVTTEAASAVYKRFCLTALICERIEFVVPITKAHTDEAMKWMMPAFNACTLEIVRKSKDGAEYRKRETLEQVRKEEIGKFTKELEVMVWNVWPHQSLLHHKSALVAAINQEIKSQIAAKSIHLGIFRASGGADAKVVNTALVGCAEPLAQSIIGSCTKWFTTDAFAAVSTANEKLEKLDYSPRNEELLKGLCMVVKQHVVQADQSFGRPMRWIVRRFLDAIKQAKLSKDDARAFERQVSAYILLNGLGGHLMRAGLVMGGFRQTLMKECWSVVMSSTNATLTGAQPKKQLDPTMTKELADAFDALCDKIREDPALAES